MHEIIVTAVYMAGAIVICAPFAIAPLYTTYKLYLAPGGEGSAGLASENPFPGVLAPGRMMAQLGGNDPASVQLLRFSPTITPTLEDE